MIRTVLAILALLALPAAAPVAAADTCTTYAAPVVGHVVCAGADAAAGLDGASWSLYARDGPLGGGLFTLRSSGNATGAGAAVSANATAPWTVLGVALGETRQVCVAHTGPVSVIVECFDPMDVAPSPNPQEYIAFLIGLLDDRPDLPCEPSIRPPGCRFPA